MSKESLQSIFTNLPASEFTLFIDPELVPALSALFSYKTLTSFGLQSLVMLTPPTLATPSSPTNLNVYLTRPNIAELQLIADFCLKFKDKQHTAVIVPQIEPLVNLFFEDRGVLGSLSLENWPLYSTMDPIYPSISLTHTREAINVPKLGIYPLVLALQELQTNGTGDFGKITTVGPLSHLVFQLLKQKKLEHQVSLQSKSETYFKHSKPNFDYEFGYSSNTFHGSVVEQLIIIDRDLDLTTPLLLQASYTGVIHENIGINASGVTMTSKSKVNLANDEMFSNLKTLGFAEACTQIHADAKELQELQSGLRGEDMHATDSALGGPDSQSITELRSMVSKIGSLQSMQRLVNTHAELASDAMDCLRTPVQTCALELQSSVLRNQSVNADIVLKLQNLVYQNAPLDLVLRMLCLVCLVRNGLKESVLQTVLDDILKAYGFQHLETINMLKKRGLIFTMKSNSFLNPFASAFTKQQPVVVNDEVPKSDTVLYSWNALNKAYNLGFNDMETVQEAVPYAGYVPLVTRIVEMALGFIPLSKTILEPEFKEHQATPNSETAQREAKLLRTLKKNQKNGEPPVVLVAVVGGITYSEAASISKCIQLKSKVPRQVKFITNVVLTGGDLMRAHA